MALQYTYTTLTAAIQSYASENDAVYTANIDDFIAKGENRLLRDLDLELFEAWQSVIVSGATRNVAKPADTIAVNSLFIRDPSEQEWMELPRRSFEYCIMYAPVETSQGIPQYYSEFDEDDIYVVPTPNQSYSAGNARARCTIRPSALSSGNPNTWLGDNVGDMLFQACMVEAYDFLKNEKGMEKAANKYQSLIPGVIKELSEIMRKQYAGLNTEKRGADD
jgi:hypothetical protein